MKQSSLKKWNEFFLAKIEDLKVTKILFCAIKVHKTMMWKKKHNEVKVQKKHLCNSDVYCILQYSSPRHDTKTTQKHLSNKNNQFITLSIVLVR